MSAIIASGSVLYRGEIAGALNERVLNEANLIGRQLMPITLKAGKTDYFWRIKRESLSKSPTGNRGSAGNYPRDDTKFDQDTYACKEYGLEGAIPDDKARDLAKNFDLQMQVANIKSMELWRAHERRVAAKVINTSTFALSGDTGLTVTDEWDDTENGKPYTDVAFGARAIAKRTGQRPNVLVVEQFVADFLGANKQLRERIGISFNDLANMGGRLSDQQIAKAVGVDRLLVGKEYYNTADDNATVSMSPIWDRAYAFLAYVSNNDPTAEPSLGRTFCWEEDGGEMTAESYRDDERRQNIVRVRHWTDEKLEIAECGFLFGGVSNL